MELTNTLKFEVDDSFDPTPKLKSSPTPILFISFNWRDHCCFYCREYYTWSFFFIQGYCKKCLSQYLTQIVDNDSYLDVRLSTMRLGCLGHDVRDKELL